MAEVGMDELMSRLGAMEQKESERQRKSEMDDFMGRFGDRFPKDHPKRDEVSGYVFDESKRRAKERGVNLVDELVEEVLLQYEEQADAYKSAVIRKVAQALEDAEKELQGSEVPSGDVGGEVVPPPMPPVPDMAEAGAPPPEGAPMPDMGAPPPGELVPPPPEEDPMISDERFKNVRAAVLSDERWKDYSGTVSDSTLKVINTLSGMTLSDEQMKNILWGADVEVSDATQKVVEQPTVAAPQAPAAPKVKEPLNEGRVILNALLNK